MLLQGELYSKKSKRGGNQQEAGQTSQVKGGMVSAAQFLAASGLKGS